jgi:hypothetical protein
MAALFVLIEKGLMKAPWLIASMIATLLASSALAADQGSPVYRVSAVLKDATGKEIGLATFSATPSGTLLDLNLTAAQPGVRFTFTRSANASRLISSRPARTSIRTRPGMAS